MKQKGESMPTQLPATRFRARVIALRETFVKLGAALDVRGHAQQRPDGRWAVPTTLTLRQLEPLVAAGATVVLEGLADPCLPQEWIMPYEQGVAEAEQLVQLLMQRDADVAKPGDRDV
jgi:hypothetical protein